MLSFLLSPFSEIRVKLNRWTHGHLGGGRGHAAPPLATPLTADMKVSLTFTSLHFVLKVSALLYEYFLCKSPLISRYRCHEVVHYQNISIYLFRMLTMLSIRARKAKHSDTFHAAIRMQLIIRQWKLSILVCYNVYNVT